MTVEASPVDIVNSNGAGDALIGTFLAYADIVSDKKALKEAVSYATKVCKVNGPRLQVQIKNATYVAFFYFDLTQN